jgi:anti-sigma regulatory factor (Ser/Thr protein kinase)
LEKLIIHNSLTEIQKVSDLLDVLQTAWGIDEETVYELKLVFDELLSNIVFYAYSDDKQHDINITLSNSKNEKQIMASISDDGKAFDPTKFINDKIANSSFDDIEPGKLGIHLVRSLVDDVKYERKNDFNILMFSKSYNLKNI